MTADEMLIQPEQVKAARAWLGWTREELARQADVGLQSVNRLESETGPYPRRGTQRLIVSAFQAAGVEFPDAETVRRRRPDNSQQSQQAA